MPNSYGVAGKPLDAAVIDKLLQQERAKAKSTTWFHGERLESVALAVSRRDETVLIEGKRYRIRYDHRWPKYVFINPTDGRFVPCACLDKEELKRVLA